MTMVSLSQREIILKSAFADALSTEIQSILSMELFFFME